MYSKSQLQQMGFQHAKALGVNELFAAADGNFFKEESYAQLHKQNRGVPYYPLKFGSLPAGEATASSGDSGEEIPELIEQLNKEEKDLNESAKADEQEADKKNQEADSDKADDQADDELSKATAKELIALIEEAKSEESVNKLLGYADERITVLKAGEKKLKEFKK